MQKQNLSAYFLDFTESCEICMNAPVRLATRLGLHNIYISNDHTVIRYCDCNMTQD